MRPACVNCCVMMRCRENGIAVIVDDSSLYFADLYECEYCGDEVVSGWGDAPAARQGDLATTALWRRWESIAMRVSS